MRTKLIPLTTGMAVTLATLVICGCAISPAPRLYLLRSEMSPTSHIAKDENDKPLIILRPIQMAEYLNRPQIVLRKDEREVAHAEFDRWAEPLDSQTLTYLTDTLASGLKDFDVRSFPWRGNTEPTYEIKISIIQLDGTPEDSVRLIANWLICSTKKTRRIIAEERTDIHSKCTEPGMTGVLTATEKVLDALGADIVTAIEKTSGQ